MGPVVDLQLGNVSRIQLSWANWILNSFFNTTYILAPHAVRGNMSTLAGKRNTLNICSPCQKWNSNTNTFIYTLSMCLQWSVVCSCSPTTSYLVRPHSAMPENHAVNWHLLARLTICITEYPFQLLYTNAVVSSYKEQSSINFCSHTNNYTRSLL